MSTVAKKYIKNSTKFVRGGSKFSKEREDAINEFLNFIVINDESDEDKSVTKEICYTIDDLRASYTKFKELKDNEANEKLRDKFTIFINKMKANAKTDQNNYDETVSTLLNYLAYLLGEALSPIFNYENLVLCDTTYPNKQYKLLCVLNKENLPNEQKEALEKYNAELIKILDLFSEFDSTIQNDKMSNLDTLYNMAEKFHRAIELAKPILNEQLILIDQVRSDISKIKDPLSSKGGKGDRSLTKYKSTGQIVFILYKKKKIKRTIYAKEKSKTKYCKINNEYILLSKLNAIE